MGKTIAAILAMALLTGASAGTPDPFEGSWRTDLSSLQFPKQPEDILLAKGVYACRSCTPPFSIRADRSFHALSGTPGVDERRIDVIDTRTIRQIDRKAGRIVHEAAIRLSADGRSRTIAWSDIAGPNAPSQTGTTIQNRIGHPVAGTHPLSGRWLTVKVTGVSDAAMTETLTLQNGFLSMSRASGESYRAQIDGPPAAYIGNPSITQVLVARAGPRKLVETSIYRGDVISVMHRSISADGRTQMLRAENRRTGAVSSARSNRL